MRRRIGTFWVRDLPAVLSLWALVFVFFWGIALAGQVLGGGDVFTYFYPYWAEATRAFRAGRLPLWNPYLFMGTPFLANSQAGVFYPLNWPLWWLLPAYRSVHLTIVLHLCLAALNAYVWGRTSLRMRRLGAWAVGCIYALGGYLGAQVEHVNQLQGLAWLPLMLMLWDKSLDQRVGASTDRRSRISNLPFAALVVVVALVFVVGHTQTAFITLVGLAAYGLGPGLWRALRWREWRPLLRQLALLTGATALGMALAAVQLIPTWELSRLSIRAGGLPFNERVSFSLSPFYLARALLPGFAGAVPPEQIEYVAYVGVAGLALAVLAIVNRQIGRPALLAFLGLFLSLGLYNPVYLFLARFVPGFAHFRVPARWLALYALGMAALAGWGIETVWRRARLPWRRLLTIAAMLLILAGWGGGGPSIGEHERVAWPTVVGWACGIVLALALLIAARRVPRFASVGLLTLLVVELFKAGSALPYRRATAPQAFTSLRPAIAHLLASPLTSPLAPSSSPRLQGEGEGTGEGLGGYSRFLSMSNITFDPGDLGEIEVIYGPQLSDAALYDLIVAAKQKEVLSPNLPLAFGVPAVDGYDGGVLPLARYAALQRLLLPEERVSMDGRLRENLTAIPDERWLNLFNVGYVLTDKLHDAWLDGVFYDLQFGARLAQGESAAVACVPPFEATALGLVSYLEGTSSAKGTLVGVVEVGFANGITRTFELRAGENVTRSETATRLRWSPSGTPVTVTVRGVLPDGEWVVRGVSLIDERTSSFQALVLSDQGRFCLVHSGDVKIYENLDVLPRAFLVHRAVMAESAEAALTLMQAPAFDPAEEVVLEGDGIPGSARNGIRAYREERVVIVSYRPERVEIAVSLDSPGYLVLSDAWYPGWQAMMDGQQAEIYRANVLFRAVAVDAGEHRIVFAFRPASVRAGGIVSVVGMVGWFVCWLVSWLVSWLVVLSKAGHDAIMAIADGLRGG